MSCIQGNCYIKIILFNLKYLFLVCSFLRKNKVSDALAELCFRTVAITEVLYLIWNCVCPVEQLELHPFILTEHTVPGFWL